MTMEASITNFIKSLNADGGASFDADSNLIESGLIDSVGMMELVVWCEEEFGVEVDTDDLVPENFASVNAIAEFIERARGG